MSGSHHQSIILNAVVRDVIDEHYVLQTDEGEYKLPVGAVNMENGMLISIDTNKYLKLIINDVENETNELEEEILQRNVAEWSERPSKLLIELYRENKKLVENRKIKTMKRMWEIIRDELNKHGYNYTSQQCETRWKSLERAFKNKIENNKKSGRGRKTCPYEKELAEILIERNTIFPPIIMDAGTEKTQRELLMDSGIENINTEIENLDSPSSSATSSTPIPKRRKVNTTRKELQQLKEAIETRNTDQKLNEDRRYEQRERLLTELKRRNDILEKLVSGD